MIGLITKKEAHAFRKRMRLVNAREIAEMQSASMELKLQQFYSLLALGRQLGWTEELARDEPEVRQRWVRLRKALSGKKG